MIEDSEVNGSKNCEDWPYRVKPCKAEVHQNNV
jgi:hypothetical protein